MTLLSTFAVILKARSRKPEDEMRCWLCEYSDDPVAKQCHQYAIDQVQCMEVTTISQVIHVQLEQSVGSMTEGISQEEVLTHFTQHTIAPNIRVALGLRSLLNLAKKLEDVTTTTDEETGLTIVDAKNVTVYLKVLTDIMSIYKAGDASKLMFAINNGKPH